MMVIFFNRIDGNSYGKGGPLKRIGIIFETGDGIFERRKIDAQSDLDGT